jgi:TolB protein
MKLSHSTRKIIFLLLIFMPLIYAPVMAVTSQSDMPHGQIAFIQFGGKNGHLEKDICIVTIETDDEACVSNTSNYDEYDPAWSPDGKYLIYHVAELPFGSAPSVTYVYDLEHETFETMPRSWYSHSWSADGSRFLTTDDYSGQGTSEIYAVRLSDYQVERLTNNDVYDFNPMWSPDEKQIGYVSGYPDGNLMLMSADGSDQKQLTDPPMKINQEYKPAWSPDGKQIAFVVNGDFIGSDQTSEIYVINADGSNIRQLTKTGGANLNPQWSPNGAQLVFYGYAVGAFDDMGSRTSLRTEVFRMNADGSDLVNLTNSTGLDYQPTWSPDGNWIAFASTRESPGIFIMRPDGTDIHMVTHQPPFSEGGREGSYPVWRPEAVKP